ncbi:MAG: hypothetical protein MUO77_01265 [Anaerolineales bacterium]|nr:hypothetical protein [Anaerolineales bacterium]
MINFCSSILLLQGTKQSPVARGLLAKGTLRGRFARNDISFLVLCIIAMTLTACSALDIFAAPSLPISVTETPPPSATLVWFPPSATPTIQLFATKTATPEKRPGLGEVTLTDNFSDADSWNTSTSDQGSATIERNRLTLAVQSGIYMLSLKNELVPGNFYAEITARPGLCRGADEYGLLVRANAVAYYRFALTCDGQVHAERISVYEKHPLQESILSGDVPIGAPSEVRIGVWALGTEMRLFLNGRYQFTIADPNYASGTLGVFAQSASDTPVTVNFSNLIVQQIELVPPTKTPHP